MIEYTFEDILKSLNTDNNIDNIFLHVAAEKIAIETCKLVVKTHYEVQFVMKDHDKPISEKYIISYLIDLFPEKWIIDAIEEIKNEKNNRY